MINHKMKMIGLSMAVLMLIPFTTAHAYRVTETSAQRITTDYALFTVRYTLGFSGREVAVPLTATRNDTNTANALSYELQDANGQPVQDGVVHAMVLSKTPIGTDNHYRLPLGRNGEFTLVALVKTRGIEKPVRLAITKLPFTVINGPVTLGASVPKDQLSLFRTDLVETRALGK